MRLLDRYLLRELLVALVFCLSGFLILWDFSDLFGELHGMQEKHLLARDILQYYLYKTPEFFILVLPVALLLALLWAMTNHARHNELTAIRAAGVSLWRLSLPYLAVGMAATTALFLLNEFYAPQSGDIAEQILVKRMQRRQDPEQRFLKKPLDFVNASIAGEGRKWHADVYNTRTFEMLNPKVIWMSTNNTRLWLYADRAIWTNGVWAFLGKARELEEIRSDAPMHPLRQTNALTMAEFSETPEEIQGEININEYLGLHNKTRRADIPLQDLINYLRLHPRPAGNLRSWLFTKLHGRFAGPCACFVVVLVAVPFAAGSGRRNAFVGVAASIFLCLLYFVLQQLGLAFGEAGLVPSWLGAWLPNLFFGLGGLVMMAKVR